MKNRWFPVIALVIMIALISAGCGVSKSEYNAVVVELDLVKQNNQVLQTQLQETQSQLIDAKTDLATAWVELETAQNDLETAQGQLQNAQAQVQSLQDDLDAARILPDEALGYAEFMDILMYEVWLAAGVTPNYTFSNAGEYQAALESKADDIGDAQLMSFVDEIETGPVSKDRLYEMCYYCLDKLEAILK